VPLFAADKPAISSALAFPLRDFEPALSTSAIGFIQGLGGVDAGFQGFDSSFEHVFQRHF